MSISAGGKRPESCEVVPACTHVFECASQVSNVKPVCDCEYGAVREQQDGVKIERLQAKYTVIECIQC